MTTRSKYGTIQFRPGRSASLRTPCWPGTAEMTTPRSVGSTKTKPADSTFTTSATTSTIKIIGTDPLIDRSRAARTTAYAITPTNASHDSAPKPLITVIKLTSSLLLSIFIGLLIIAVHC
ncbi:MAG: hypothetical protein PVF83_08110 [Anaerolineales bacterium]